MPTLQLRYPLAALLIAAGCTGGSPTADDPDGEAAADSSLSLLRDGLRVSPGAVDLGVVEIGQSGTAQVQLTNTRLLPIRLEPRIAPAGFAVDDDCGTFLRGRASCTIHVGFSPDATGAASGILTIASRFQRHLVPLTGSGGRRVTVSLAGPGTGHITSTPAGIDCGTTCSALFTGDVTLTAMAGDGSRFVGWSAPCPSDAACALPADTASVSATFEPADTRRITVNVAGEAPGFVYLNSEGSIFGATPCPQPCTIYVPTGSPVRLVGFTPSTFGGWTGCAVADSDPHACNLGSVTSDVSPTVTFHRDEREVATLLPPRDVRGLAFTPDGDVLIADLVGITRMTLSGSVVWSVAIPNGARDIVTDAAGHIYGSSIPFRPTAGAGLFALDSSGTLLWMRTDITVAPNNTTSFASAVAASPDGTVIAAHQSDGVRVVDGNGADRFVVGGVSADGMAVAPDGTVAIGKDSPTIAALVAAGRFTATGEPLPDIDPIPGDFNVAMAFDASNALCALTTAFHNAHTSRTLADTTPVFDSRESEPGFGIPPGDAMAVDSLGEPVAARWLVDDAGATGLHLEVFSPAGAILWTHDKGTEDRPFDIVNDGVTLTQLTTDNNRHIAVAGAWNMDSPWIQIYAMP